MDIQPIRFETSRALLIAGLRQHHTGNPSQTIPPQWARFKSHLDKIPSQIGYLSYGVSTHCTEIGHFEYLCGVEVSDAALITPPLSLLSLPAQLYAVFEHSAAIATIKDTYTAIWEIWLSTSGHQIADTPFFERYDQRFDPQKGKGTIEIWIPLKQ